MFPATYAALVSPPLALGRITAQDRGAYSVSTSTVDVRATLAGRLRFGAGNPENLPVVGDYVALDVNFGAREAVILRVLPRTNLFSRRAVGGAHTLAPIAANLDTLFVTVAVDGDFNLRRIERYLVGAAACGVPVALALTKMDLAADPAAFVLAAQSAAPDTPIIPLCTTRGEGLDALASFRGPSRTIGFVGSSGVGKSTLINALVEGRRLATGAIRADGRGRHTTTRRELVVLADGTAVIDTPGMREFALADAECGVDEAFDDVTELAMACRFRDCRHDAEPGCAVRDSLDGDRLQNWRKLRREAAFEARKADAALARADQARWKAIQRANRARYRDRGR